MLCSCIDATTRSPPTAGTYSEYNITVKSFDSDACAASTLNDTDRYNSKVCDDSQGDDYYNNGYYYYNGGRHSTAFDQSLARITKDRLRHEKKQHRRSVIPPSSAAVAAAAGIAGASSSSTRYSDYCLVANRAPSSPPSSSPSYGYGSPTPAPTQFEGVKFSSSQVSCAHCLLVFRCNVMSQQ